MVRYRYLVLSRGKSSPSKGSWIERRHRVVEIDPDSRQIVNVYLDSLSTRILFHSLVNLSLEKFIPFSTLSCLTQWVLTARGVGTGTYLTLSSAVSNSVLWIRIHSDPKLFAGSGSVIRY